MAAHIDHAPIATVLAIPFTIIAVAFAIAVIGLAIIRLIPAAACAFIMNLTAGPTGRRTRRGTVLYITWWFHIARRLNVTRGLHITGRFDVIGGRLDMARRFNAIGRCFDMSRCRLIVVSRAIIGPATMDHNTKWVAAILRRFAACTIRAIRHAARNVSAA